MSIYFPQRRRPGQNAHPVSGTEGEGFSAYSSASELTESNGNTGS